MGVGQSCRNTGIVSYLVPGRRVDRLHPGTGGSGLCEVWSRMWRVLGVVECVVACVVA